MVLTSVAFYGNNVSSDGGSLSLQDHHHHLRHPSNLPAAAAGKEIVVVGDYGHPSTKAGRCFFVWPLEGGGEGGHHRPSSSSHLRSTEPPSNTQQKFHCRKISAPSFASTLKNLNSNNSPSSDQSYPDSDAQRFQHHHHYDQAASSNVVVDSGYSPLHIKKRPKHPPPPASGDQDLAGLDYQSQTTGEVGGDRCCFSATDLSRIVSLEEALTVIKAMQAKCCHCRGQQIIAYRKKVRQQKSDMGQLRAEHERQLDDISTQLMRFEASLRAKEKQISKMLAGKEQVITRQQKLIKKLLKKRDSSNDLFDETEVKKFAAACTTDPEMLNDSDSAIIIDVGVGELTTTGSSITGEQTPEIVAGPTTCTEEAKVIRSVSDVVKTSSGNNECPPSPAASTTNNLEMNQAGKPLNGRKTKEERRISNRQKLLALKRHSGFLKRPEILETVYSVEEDGENVAAAAAAAAAAQKEQPQQQPQKPQQQSNNNLKSGTTTSIGGSASPVRKGCSSSTNTAPVVILTAFRRRLDSDLTTTTCSDCSTDDESTRMLYSETESITCSCSQPCSRRSSCGYICQCLQCSGGGGGCVTASAPTSRRSSTTMTGALPASVAASSSAAASTTMVATAAGSSNQEVTQTFNRVMSNHRNVVKPKDVKFKRINKAKSRSLEELRGKLKYPSGSSSINEDDIDELDDLDDDDVDDGEDLDDDEASTSGAGTRPDHHTRRNSSNNRLALLRDILSNQNNSSFERESTTTDPDLSTN